MRLTFSIYDYRAKKKSLREVDKRLTLLNGKGDTELTIDMELIHAYRVNRYEKT